MNENMEKLAGIEPGDSNEVCLAKTLLAIETVTAGRYLGPRLAGLLHEGTIYAGEVLNARS